MPGSLRLVPSSSGFHLSSPSVPIYIHSENPALISVERTRPAANSNVDPRLRRHQEPGGTVEGRAVLLLLLLSQHYGAGAQELTSSRSSYCWIRPSPLIPVWSSYSDVTPVIFPFSLRYQASHHDPVSSPSPIPPFLSSSFSSSRGPCVIVIYAFCNGDWFRAV